MKDKITGEFVDLNQFKGLGEDPVYHQPILVDRERFWPLDRLKTAPKDLGYDDMPNVSWRGYRLLKDPSAQACYHNLLWELKPKTIIELGIYGGGSLVWFRDLTLNFGFQCNVIGIDKDLSRCQIQKEHLNQISINEGDCNSPEESLNFLANVEHPILFIDDAHCNTFNVLKYAINNILLEGDYVVIEDTMPIWKRYSPNNLQSNLSAFKDVLKLDLLYSNVDCQLRDGVFKVISS